MAKQEGLILFVGKIDDLSFYLCKGIYIVRRAGGPTREQIKHGKAFERVRRNNCEFGGASTAGKAFRGAFAVAIRKMQNPDLAPKATQVFYKMCKLDDGVPGQRAVLCSQYGYLLEGLELNPMVPFDSLFKMPLDMSYGVNRDMAMLTINHLKPAQMIKAPTGATHFKMCLMLGALPDFRYDDVIDKYTPLVPGFDGLHAFSDSGLLSLEDLDLSFKLETTLPQGVIIPASVSMVATVGIEFYQWVNGVDYLLESGRGMRVVRCF